MVQSDFSKLVAETKIYADYPAETLINIMAFIRALCTISNEAVYSNYARGVLQERTDRLSFELADSLPTLVHSVS